MSRTGVRRLATLAAVAVAVCLTVLGAASGLTSGPYVASLTGAPAAPAAEAGISGAALADFDVQVQSRDSDTWYQLNSINAQHGADCGAPPATHVNTSYEGSVFQCKDHIMTSLNAGGYGVIYLTPNRMLDFSASTGVLRWDQSTLRMSLRDFTSVWITPYDDNIALPFDEGEVDLQGVPRQGIHIQMDQFNGETIFRAYQISNFQSSEIAGCWWCTVDQALAAAGRAPSATVRDTFEIQISANHLKFGVPALNYWPIDSAISPLAFTQGVVQWGHHSYNPTKDGAGVPGTWHWDNFTVDPSVPFSMTKADFRFIDSPVQTLDFVAPAPTNGSVRFAGIGTIQVSFDGGKTYQPAKKAASSFLATNYHPEHMSSYWMPIPAGTTTMKLKFAADGWYQGPFIAKDFSIWSRSGVSSPAGTTIPPTSTPTSAAPTATSTTAATTATATKAPSTATPTAVPPTPTQSGSTSPVTTAGTRIAWNSGKWFLLGANLPWYNWGCDFGCGSLSGASSPTTTAAVDAAFAQAKQNGVRTIRWWLFPGDPWQITRDGSGAPTGVNSTVYTDIDAAIQLAAKYDLYLDFVLFSGPTAVPSAWVNDPVQRTKLSQALAPMFARYKGNSRVMTWEVVNEPEFDIWAGKISQASVQATVKSIAAAVHSNSSAYVTVGSAMLDGLPMWVGQGLDYYQAHWYDYMQPGAWCARCTDYATVKSQYGLDAPLVIGEFFAGSSVDALQRYEDFYAKGYAGAWAWSLLPGRTSDGLDVNLAAVATFASRHSDDGPQGAGASPTPTATPTNAAATATPTKAALTATPTNAPSSGTITTSESLSPTSVAAGKAIKLTTKVTSSSSVSALVDVEIYGPSGTKVYQAYYDNQSLAGKVTKTYSSSWSVPKTAAKGTYTVKIGVFKPGWAGMYVWTDSAATFTVK